jgi:hypothetical protein
MSGPAMTEAGRVLTGVVIFLGIGLLGFASAQLTAKLLPQRNEVADLKAALARQEELLMGITSRLDSQSDARTLELAIAKAKR